MNWYEKRILFELVYDMTSYRDRVGYYCKDKTHRNSRFAIVGSAKVRR